MPAVFRLTGLFLILLASCTSGPDKSFYLNEIDSLTIVLMQKTNKLESLDTSMIKWKSENLAKSIHLLDSLTPDTVNPKIDLYYKINKSLEVILQKNQVLINELNISEKQMFDLKHDIQLGLIKDNKMQEFLDQEKEQALKTIDLGTMFYERAMMTLHQYDSAMIEIDSLTSFLKERQQVGKK